MGRCRTIRSCRSITPIGSEIMVSTFPVRRTEDWTCSSSTIPRTTLIRSLMCGFDKPELDDWTSCNVSSRRFWAVEQHALLTFSPPLWTLQGQSHVELPLAQP